MEKSRQENETFECYARRIFSNGRLYTKDGRIFFEGEPIADVADDACSEIIWASIYGAYLKGKEDKRRDASTWFLRGAVVGELAIALGVISSIVMKARKK